MIRLTAGGIGYQPVIALVILDDDGTTELGVAHLDAFEAEHLATQLRGAASELREFRGLKSQADQ